MLRTLVFFTLLVSVNPFTLSGQEPTSGTTPAKPVEHILGSVTAVDANARTITVKDDKSGVETVVALGGTRTLLKVAPGAKDLKTAVRITAADLEVGDRVDVRGSKQDSSIATVDARSVVLMSARELAQKRQEEVEAWQNSTVGTIATVDPGSNSFTMNVRTPAGPKTVTVQTSGTTEWTRYSGADPKVPVHSAFADLQAGDQVRLLGQKTSDETGMTAEKVYSAPVRTIAATVTSIAPDGKQIVAKNLQSKQPVTITLPTTAVVRKLDPQTAMMMARRFGANTGSAQGGPNATTAPGGYRPNATPPAEGQPTTGGAPSGGPGAPGGPNVQGQGMRRGGDMAHLLERIPEISAADLKPGDAIVIWGMAGQNPGSVDAQTVLAGVEPVLQSAPLRQGQSLNADWGLETGVPAQ